MTINLISEQEYNFLIDCQKKYPDLTYQNKGYDTPNKAKWSKETLETFIECEKILKKAIKGFEKFNHFKLTKTNEVAIRFQYDWTADEPYETKTVAFTGVGYLFLEELHKGFRKNE